MQRVGEHLDSERALVSQFGEVSAAQSQVVSVLQREAAGLRRRFDDAHPQVNGQWVPPAGGRNNGPTADRW